MRYFFTLVFFLFACVAFSQTPCIVKDSVLYFPSNIKKSTMLVFKRSDVVATSKIASGKGEIQGYTITYPYKGIYSSKTIPGTNFSGDTRYVVGLAPNRTKIVFELFIKTGEGDIKEEVTVYIMDKID